MRGGSSVLTLCRLNGYSRPRELRSSPCVTTPQSPKKPKSAPHRRAELAGVRASTRRHARPRHEHSLGSRVGSRAEAPAPRRPHRKSRRSDHAACQRGHRSARCPPPAGTERVHTAATHQCSASHWHRARREAVAALPVSRAAGQQLGCLQWRLDPPQPTSALASPLRIGVRWSAAASGRCFRDPTSPAASVATSAAATATSSAASAPSSSSRSRCRWSSRMCTPSSAAR